MTLVLELPVSVEEALRREARRRGVTPERLALEDLRRLYPAQETEAGVEQDTAARVARFLAWADGHDRTVPVIPLDALDREHLYADVDKAA